MCAYDYPHIALIISYPIVLPYIDTLIFERVEGKRQKVENDDIFYISNHQNNTCYAIIGLSS